MTEHDAWIVLASVDGVAEATFATLLVHHGSAAAVLAAALEGRLEASGAAAGGAARLGPVLRERIRAAARDPAPLLERVRALGLWTVTMRDEAYPSRLRVLDTPPAVVHGWGDVAALTRRRAVAVVGTRRPTLVGRALATRVAALLVDCGATVVSGLAFGIDGAAHAATLDAGGVTVGIIGAGHAHAGPRGHRRLLDRIVTNGGAVIGELAPDVMPTRGTFPRRNRLISALADAVIVVEAPARSGALITARTAMEQGRPVFVAPGRPGDPATGGCLALLRETPARPIAGLDELVVDLGYDSAAAAAPDPNARLGRAAALELLGAAERRVAEPVVRGPAGPDELVAATGLAPATVSAALTLLQMRGWIAPLGPAYLARGPLLGDG